MQSKCNNPGQTDFALQVATQTGDYAWWPAEDRLAWSPGLLRIYGLANPPLAEQGFSHLIHPDDRVRVQAETSEYLGSDATSYSHMFRIVRPDGAIRTVLDRGEIQRDTHGQVRLMRGINVDLTDLPQISMDGSLQSGSRANDAAISRSEPAEELTHKLAVSEARLRRAAEAAGFGIYEFDPSQQVSIWSKEMHNILGTSVDNPISTENILNTIHPADREQVQARMQLIQRVIGRYDLEFRIMRPDGNTQWVMDRGEAIGPINSDTGLVSQVAGTVLDISQRKKAEESLRSAHDTFQHLVDHCPFGIYIVDADFCLHQVSDGAQKVFENVRPLIGRNFADILRAIWPEPFATETIDRFRHTLDTGESYHAQSTVEKRADIDATEAYDWKVERITLADGRPGVVCHFYDLSERQQHAEHVQLVMHEINHRAKNMLSLVQAMARQTVMKNPEDFAQRFGARIQALAAAQDLLIKHESRAIPIGELVEFQLSHFKDLIGDRISITGPAIWLKPDVGQTLGMVLHELATNAAKYGALSNTIGRLGIDWRVKMAEECEPHFTLSWEERGGPAVKQPDTVGFGSKVTTDMVSMTLDGEVSVDYKPSGIVWRLSCPVSKLVETGTKS